MKSNQTPSPSTKGGSTAFQGAPDSRVTNADKQPTCSK